MGLFGFGGDNEEKIVDTVTGVVDGATKGIDALFYTNEEKAKAGQQAYDSVLEMIETVRDENTARSITRRVLAIMIVGEFLVLLLVSAIAAPWDMELSKIVFSFAKELSTLVLTVVIFYFGYYGIQKNITAIKRKGKGK